MSICDGCIHDYVCGLEDNHEDGIVSCADRIPKDVFGKIRAEIDSYCSDNRDRNDGLYIAMKIIDKYKASPTEAEEE